MTKPLSFEDFCSTYLVDEFTDADRESFKAEHGLDLDDEVKAIQRLEYGVYLGMGHDAWVDFVNGK